MWNLVQWNRNEYIKNHPAAGPPNQPIAFSRSLSWNYHSAAVDVVADAVEDECFVGMSDEAGAGAAGTSEGWQNVAESSS